METPSILKKWVNNLQPVQWKVKHAQDIFSGLASLTIASATQADLLRCLISWKVRPMFLRLAMGTLTQTRWQWWVISCKHWQVYFFLSAKVQTITLEKHIIQAISSTFTEAHSSSGWIYMQRLCGCQLPQKTKMAPALFLRASSRAVLVCSAALCISQ